jgi:hypothetical protein
MTTETREELERSWQTLVQEEEREILEDRGETSDKTEGMKGQLEQHKDKVGIEVGRIQGTHYQK